ncbi:hypothetical protein AUJ68_06230 [Candidatus Woesearchaeota archaeon CG1_02_57_44]|nr:MAG: hypothetical protein AUJ68_06230 [Candidatus Woesearchaeota archaeon CG1_02_57_44]
MIFRETGLDVSSAQYPPADRRMAVLPCLLLWHSPQINWDGRLLGCCVNTWQDFGNVFSDGLSACMDSERYQHTKKMLQGKAGPRDDIPCVRCPRFAGISKHPLRAQDLLLPL